MKTIAVDGLPEEALAAAGLFHQHWLPRIEHALEGGHDVLVALASANHSHAEWRLSIAAGLARKHTPRRVNLVSGEGAVVEAFAAYLAEAPGITGQYFEGDGHGAGDPAG